MRGFVRGSIRAAWLVIVGLATSAAVAQTSELYLTDFNSSALWVVQGGQIVRQFDRSSIQDGPSCAVLGTIRCVGQDGGSTGHEYSLVGAPLAGSYLNPSFDSLYDAATDGARYWSIAHNDGATNYALVEADSSWGGIHVLFSPANRSSGVTWDAVSSSLWITNTMGTATAVQQVNLSGTVLSSFPVSVPGGYSIAWDPADDTLWIPGSGTGTLYQYSKAGVQLQVVTVPGLTGYIVGAEFGGAAAPRGATVVPTLGGGALAAFALAMAAAGAFAVKGTLRG